MKLTCKRDALLAACQSVAAAVPTRTTREALGCVKASASGDALTLTAFDTEVPFGALSQILKEGGDDEVSLDATAEGTRVRVGTSRYDLPARPVDEFPDLPAFDDGGRYHEVAAGVLRSLVRRTAFAADRKDSGGKFALKGVLWEAGGGVVRLVATDTKRLAACEGPAACFGVPDDGKTSHLVPPKAIALLERNLADDGDLVRVGLRNNDALFQTGRATVYTTLVQGRYPPYRDILAMVGKGKPTQISLPGADFLARVRQAAIVTDDESKRVEMTFSPGKVAMSARGADTGSSEVELALPDFDGPGLEVAFDPSFLVEFLRAVEGEAEVVLEAVSAEKPVLFRCGDAFRYLVMPLAG